MERPRAAMLVTRGVMAVAVRSRVGEMPFRNQEDRVLQQFAHAGNERQQKNGHEDPRGKSAHVGNDIRRITVRQRTQTRAVRDGTAHGG